MIILDTHILLWWLLSGGKLTAKQKQALSEVSPGNPACVCTITLWEVAMLHAKGRIELPCSLREFLELATAPPLVKRQEVTPEIAAVVYELIDTFHGDPADRIIVATAKALGASLMTVDEKIIASSIVPICR